MKCGVYKIEEMGDSLCFYVIDSYGSEYFVNLDSKNHTIIETINIAMLFETDAELRGMNVYQVKAQSKGGLFLHAASADKSYIVFIKI